MCRMRVKPYCGLFFGTHCISLQTRAWAGGGVYFLVKGYWECADEWRRTFTKFRIDYNGVTFLVELLEWGRTFLGFLG